ncbi:hypothetical protein ACFL6D_02270 [Spirochaetota bacterium]
MKRLIIITVLCISIITPLLAARERSLFLGLKVPIKFEANFTKEAGTWLGYNFGGGLFFDLKLSNKFSLGTFGSFSLDTIYLPEELYNPDTFMKFMNIRYGFDIKQWFLNNAFAGFGITVAYTFAGNFGDETRIYSFADDTLGSDIYFALIGGYAFFVAENIYIPVALELNCDLTIKDAFLFEAGISAAFAYKINFK